MAVSFTQTGVSSINLLREGHTLLEPKVLRVGDRVRVVRKVLDRDDIARRNRFVSNETGEERYQYSVVDVPTDEIGIGVVHIASYPHPWPGYMTGGWLSSMDRTIGFEGVVTSVLSSDNPEVIRSGGRVDCSVQVRVDYPDGTYRLWWYSRLALAYIPEEEMDPQSNDVEAPELRPVPVNYQEGTPVGWVPDLSPGMVRSIPAPSPAIPELRPGLAQETVPELRPGLVQEPVSVIPELRPGLATAATATTGPLVEGQERPVFYAGDEVEVVRAVYSGEQRRVYEGTVGDDTYDFPNRPIFDDAWRDCWINEMNNLIGHRGTVTEIHRVRGPIVEFGGEDYLETFAMSPFSLRLIRRGGMEAETDMETSQPDTAQAVPDVPSLRPGTVLPSSAPILTEDHQPLQNNAADPFRNARLGMIIGGSHESEEYFVLGISPINELIAGGEELGMKVIGRHFDDGRLEYSPYLKRLIRLVTGLTHEVVPPVTSYAHGEISRSVSVLKTIYIGFAYQQEDQVPEEDDIDEISTPSYWLAVVDLSTNSDGVVTSGASISGINERVYI